MTPTTTYPKWATALATEWCTSCGRSILKGALALRGPARDQVRCQGCGNAAEKAERNRALKSQAMPSPARRRHSRPALHAPQIAYPC